MVRQEGGERCFVLATLAAAACLAAAAAPSSANIEDPNAEPNHAAVVDRGGVDYAEDVVIVGGYVYVCGQVDRGHGCRRQPVRMTVAGGATALWTSALAGRDHAVAMAVAPGGDALYEHVVHGGNVTCSRARTPTARGATAAQWAPLTLGRATSRWSDAGNLYVTGRRPRRLVRPSSRWLEARYSATLGVS